MGFGGLFDILGGGGGGGGGGFSGGGIGSSQSAQQTDTKDFSRIDNRVVQAGAFTGGDLTISSGDNSAPTTYNISQTDPGAIKAGLDIARAGIDSVNTQSINSATALQSIASDSINQAYGLANQARQSETSGAINALTKYLFWVALAGVAAWAIVKTSK
jgi:hypothetical protein